MGAELFVELFKSRQCAHPITPVLCRDDVAGFFVEVVFVLDIADDLLQHVLYGDQSRHAAVFIDDDCNMVPVHSEIVQQYVQAHSIPE